MTSNNNFSTMGQWSMTFTREEHLAIGLTYAIVIPAVYIPYILVIKIFFTDTEFKKYDSYRIMAHLGIIELYLLLYYFIRAIKMITYIQLWPIINQVLGTVGYSAYNCAILMALVLAISRFDVLYNFMEEKANRKLYTFLIMLVYCYGLFTCVIHFLPGNSIVTDMTRVDFEKTPLHTGIIQVETIGKLTVVGCYAILYAGTIVLLYNQRKKMTLSTFSVQERKLLVQSIIVCSYKAMITVAYWYYVPPNRLAIAILLTITVLEASYNPILYLIMNKKLRSLLKFWNFSNNIFVQPIANPNQRNVKKVKEMDQTILHTTVLSH